MSVQFLRDDVLSLVMVLDGSEFVYATKVGEFMPLQPDESVLDASPLSPEAAQELRDNLDRNSAPLRESASTERGVSYPHFYETHQGNLITFYDQACRATIFNGEKTWAWSDVPVERRSPFGGFGADRISAQEAQEVRQGLKVAAARQRSRGAIGEEEISHAAHAG